MKVIPDYVMFGISKELLTSVGSMIWCIRGTARAKNSHGYWGGVLGSCLTMALFR